jgi:hypothetical protein
MGCTAHGKALTAWRNYIVVRYNSMDENDQKIVTPIAPALTDDG